MAQPPIGVLQSQKTDPQTPSHSFIEPEGQGLQIFRALSLCEVLCVFLSFNWKAGWPMVGLTTATDR